ncbi:MAG TPA: PPOX class F420-dependent oxidoreductase [Actinomadura sp.]|jgi:PPOX class probable F420-dependent enzyme|nr:PPOX class F420-dependent oxidoreductase [Actinomadura sp.]
MAQLSENAKELLQRPIHAWITTLRPDGTPHNTVVWVDVEDDEVIVNTAIGRAKERHLRRDPRTAVSVLDPDDPFHYVSVSGTARLETEGADSVIDRLAEKYLGVDVYPYRQPGERRITVRITPQEIIYSAGG